MTSRIVITGAQGFLGRSLAAHWPAADPDAVILGLGRSPALPGTFTHAVGWGGATLPAPSPLPRAGPGRARRRRPVGRHCRRPGDLARSFADASRRAALGVRPRHALRDSPAVVLDHYRGCLAAGGEAGPAPALTGSAPAAGPPAAG